jgi:copper homeostasis protein CutC
VIGRLVEQAGRRLVVMAGGGVVAEHVAALVAATGVREIHLSGIVLRPAVGAGFGMTPVPNPTRLGRVMDVLRSS